MPHLQHLTGLQHQKDIRVDDGVQPELHVSGIYVGVKKYRQFVTLRALFLLPLKAFIRELTCAQSSGPLLSRNASGWPFVSIMGKISGKDV